LLKAEIIVPNVEQNPWIAELLIVKLRRTCARDFKVRLGQVNAHNPLRFTKFSDHKFPCANRHG
jgi:hypothetical protein